MNKVYVHGVRGPVDPDLGQMSVRELLQLIGRGVLRSRNAPAGDLAETVVASAYQGRLAVPSEKSWDVRTAEGVLLQVKCRVIEPGSRRTHVYSPFRSWDFHACVFVVLNGVTYGVDHAIEIPVDQVKELARASSWVAGHRISVGRLRTNVGGAIDVTERLKAAYESMNRLE